MIHVAFYSTELFQFQKLYNWIQTFNDVNLAII